MKRERPLAGRRILLGVCGGIAAYKAVYLLRKLKEEDAEVRVVMTKAACEFVTPLTFETLSEEKVHLELFRSPGEGGGAVEHVSLARWPELAVVAPATANTIAKLAQGRNDDLLSAVLSAFEGRLVLAPSMNEGMWRNPATQKNLRDLSQRGVRLVPPEVGGLACGTEGVGRMAEPEEILRVVKNLYAGDFAGLRVLVSAGRTEEDLDGVRFLSNRSTGKMGFALAEAARDRGAAVTVVAGRTSVTPPPGVEVVQVRSNKEMSKALRELFPHADVLIMAAAVADFAPREPLPHKYKGDKWTLELERTEDILRSLGEEKGQRFVVGFAVETGEGEKWAREKIQRKRCDLLVLNDPSRPGAGFEHNTNDVTIFNQRGKVLSSGLRSKREVAELILDAVVKEASFPTRGQG